MRGWWPEWMNRKTAARYLDVDWHQIEEWRGRGLIEYRVLPPFTGKKPQIRVSRESLDSLSAEMAKAERQGEKMEPLRPPVVLTLEPRK